MELHITGDPAADKLLSEDAFALLTGMLLDQQVTMESAFAGPETAGFERRPDEISLIVWLPSRSSKKVASKAGASGSPPTPILMSKPTGRFCCTTLKVRA